VQGRSYRARTAGAKSALEDGRRNVREICERSRAGDSLAYTTVLSLLQVMEQKGLVGIEQAASPMRTLPRVERWPPCARWSRFLDRVFRRAPSMNTWFMALERSGRPPKKYANWKTNRSSQQKQPRAARAAGGPR